MYPTGFQLLAVLRQCAQLRLLFSQVLPTFVPVVPNLQHEHVRQTCSPCDRKQRDGHWNWSIVCTCICILNAGGSDYTATRAICLHVYHDGCAIQATPISPHKHDAITNSEYSTIYSGRSRLLSQLLSRTFDSSRPPNHGEFPGSGPPGSCLYPFNLVGSSGDLSSTQTNSRRPAKQLRTRSFVCEWDGEGNEPTEAHWPADNQQVQIQFRLHFVWRGISKTSHLKALLC